MKLLKTKRFYSIHNSTLVSSNGSFEDISLDTSLQQTLSNSLIKENAHVVLWSGGFKDAKGEDLAVPSSVVASAVGVKVGAKKVEFYEDKHGFFTVDPQQISSTSLVLNQLFYDEVRTY
jgi:hypothetical protein